MRRYLKTPFKKIICLSRLVTIDVLCIYVVSYTCGIPCEVTCRLRGLCMNVPTKCMNVRGVVLARVLHDCL